MNKLPSQHSCWIKMGVFKLCPWAEVQISHEHCWCNESLVPRECERHLKYRCGELLKYIISTVACAGKHTILHTTLFPSPYISFCISYIYYMVAFTHILPMFRRLRCILVEEEAQRVEQQLWVHICHTKGVHYNRCTSSVQFQEQRIVYTWSEHVKSQLAASFDGSLLNSKWVQGRI